MTGTKPTNGRPLTSIEAWIRDHQALANHDPGAFECALMVQGGLTVTEALIVRIAAQDPWGFARNDGLADALGWPRTMVREMIRAQAAHCSNLRHKGIRLDIVKASHQGPIFGRALPWADLWGPRPGPVQGHGRKCARFGRKRKYPLSQVGRQVEDYRARTGLTVAQVGEELGVSRGVMNAWMCGRSACPPAKWLQLLRLARMARCQDVSA